MSDLDYDALRKVAEGPRDKTTGTKREWEQAMRAFEQAFTPPTVLRLLDLAQRAEAAEAAVERVRALLTYSDGGERYERWRANEIRAALDPKADQ